MEGGPGVKLPTSKRPADPAAGTRSRDDLDRSFVHGMAWTGSLKWLAQGISWVSTLVVVRLLTPEDYGIMGMATLYLGLIQLVSEFGVGAAVLTLRELRPKQVAQLNSLALMFGLGGFAASCAMAVPLGVFFDSPRLPPVVVVVGLGFIVTSFKVVPYALLAKDLEFKIISVYGIAQALAASIITVVLAAAGLGYWALALGNLFASGLYVTLIVRRRPHPFRWPRLASIGSAMTFSSNIIVTRLSWYVYSNADFLVIGRVLGERALGVYTVGWSLSTMAVDKVSAVVGQVTPAFFSATQKDHESLRRYLLSITEILAVVTFPACIGLALVAHDFTVVVLGDRWLPVVTPLRLLAAYGIVRSLTPFLPQVLAVVGDAAFPMKVSLAAALTLPVAFLAGTRWGIVGVALVWVLAYPLISTPLYIRVFRKISLPPLDYARALWPAVSATAIMAGAVLGVRSVLPTGSNTAVLGLLAQVAAGALFYAGAVLLLHGARIRRLKAVISRARAGSTAPVVDAI